jgi:hypothetical protein
MTILQGDCREQLARLDADSVDACVTDPPYELGFMGKRWDSTGVAYDPAVWGEVLRVLKPGGFLLAFGGTRTYHRLTCAIEDAGFEVRDSIAAWLYGSGFPKGKGQLKPSWEPIVVARKPAPGPVLQIDACRVGADTSRADRYGGKAPGGSKANGWRVEHDAAWEAPAGRWPANTVLAHHPDCGDTCHPDCWVAQLDQQSGTSRSVASERGLRGRHDAGSRETERIKPYSGGVRGHNDQGGASRFFPTFRYEAKAPTRERPKVDGVVHPTVKPLALMRWLVRLVTPPGGLVLDPFLGSGTTAEAAELEGFRWVGCEQNVDYLPLIQQRLDRVADVQLRLPA